MTMIIDGTNGLTFPDSSKQYNSYYGFKNRIINGAMVIDQRNAGASVTQSNGSALYPVDRFAIYGTVSSKFTAQQNAGSVTPPAGFTKYLGITSSAVTSLAAGDYYRIYQSIEGLNLFDIAYGTANAATMTLSFRVYSSLTGTFGGSIYNSSGNRSYPFSYTISSANTWTTVNITFAGDTSSAIATDNTTGFLITWGLGVGSTYGSGTAGAWAAGNIMTPTGATSVVGTNAATFYITGVQLETGAVATSFDYRPYGTELALCQRYYFKTNDVGSATGANGAPIVGIGSSTNGCIVCGFRYPVQLRATPTIVFTSFNSTSGVWSNSANNADTAAATVNGSAASGLQQVIVTGLTTGQPYYAYATANSEL